MKNFTLGGGFWIECFGFFETSLTHLLAYGEYIQQFSRHSENIDMILFSSFFLRLPFVSCVFLIYVVDGLPWVLGIVACVGWAECECNVMLWRWAPVMTLRAGAGPEPGPSLRSQRLRLAPAPALALAATDCEWHPPEQHQSLTSGASAVDSSITRKRFQMIGI